MLRRGVWRLPGVFNKVCVVAGETEGAGLDPTGPATAGRTGGAGRSSTTVIKWTGASP